MNIELKELTQSLNQATEAIGDRLDEVEQNFTKLDDKLAQVEIAGKRFYPGDSAKTSDPDLVAFLHKGALPGVETKELSVTNDGQGVTVRGDWSDRIFKEVRETSPVRQAANVMSTDSNELEVLVDRDEPNSEWIGELDSRAKTNASFLTRHVIPVHEHYAYPEATLQMLEDSRFNVESWLQGKVATRFTRQEAAAFINADGNGKPRGILNYGTVPEASFTWGADPAAYEIGAQYTGVNGSLPSGADAEDVLYDLVDSLKAPYLPGASWMMTRAFRNQLRKLKDADNRSLLQQSLAEGVPDQLLGYPVFLAEDMPALDADVVGALFGNFREGYTVVDRVGLSVQRDAFTKPGWVRWYVRRRVGGAVTNPEAIKALVLGSEPE